MINRLIAFLGFIDLLIAVQGDICQLEKKVGPCRDLVERYYFDSAMGTCQQFFFGGCDGMFMFFFSPRTPTGGIIVSLVSKENPQEFHNITGV